jgi:GH24 family phage-related lysozyme (muramidase)
MGAKTLKNGTETLAYTLASDTALAIGLGFTGTWTPIVIKATIAQADYQDAKALVYTDVVTITFNY